MTEKPPKNADYSALHHEMKPLPKKEDGIIGQGRESIVRKYGEQYVIKEIRTIDTKGEPIDPAELVIRESSEFITSVRKDQEVLKEIYSDQLVETQFITGLDDNGNETTYRLQERIDGHSVSAKMREIGKEEFRKKHRQELLRLLYATKKATVELGMPIDIHGDNIIVDEQSDKLKVIDFGAPTITQEKIKEYPDTDRRDKTYKHIAKIYDQLHTFEGEMEFTDQERTELGEAYQYTPKDEQRFNERHQAWQDEMRELGIS